MSNGGFFSSDSQTRTRITSSDQKVAASDGGLVNAPRVNLTKSGGNTISLSYAQSDYGAIGAATELLGRTLASQANLAGNALDQLSKLSETKVTDGANLNQKTTLVALVVFGCLAAVLFFFTHRR